MFFDEPHLKQLTNIWAWFGASMAWALSYWVIFLYKYPQIALVLTALGYWPRPNLLLIGQQKAKKAC